MLIYYRVAQRRSVERNQKAEKDNEIFKHTQKPITPAQKIRSDALTLQMTL